MVNRQAELFYSPELSPDTPAADQSACWPPLWVSRCSSPGRQRLPGHGRRTGTSAIRRADHGSTWPRSRIPSRYVCLVRSRFWSWSPVLSSLVHGLFERHTGASCDVHGELRVVDRECPSL